MSELSLHVPPRLPCHRHVGHSVAGITPPSFACSVCSHFFCIDISIELPDHRNVAVAPFPFSPPWHQFHFAAVAPFSFRHGDKCLISFYTNIFIKLHPTMN